MRYVANQQPETIRRGSVRIMHIELGDSMQPICPARLKEPWVVDRAHHGQHLVCAACTRLTKQPIDAGALTTEAERNTELCTDLQCVLEDHHTLTGEPHRYLAPDEITKEQFMKLVEGFWQWTSQRPRRPSMWLLSLEDWATQEFNRADRKEKAAGQ